MASLRAIGLMSGTSLDGVDVALIETDGDRVDRFGPVGYRPYADVERDLLRRALTAAGGITDRAARPGVVAEAEALVTQAHVHAVEAFLTEHRIDPRDISVVGFHGQTVLHRPEHRLTVQIGDGQALARRIGVPVVFDLRAADAAAGGQGAPLVPVFHRALVQSLDRPYPVAVLNIGGVANVTYVGGAGELIACDTGPGNALIDDFMTARTGASCDRDGALAAQGEVDDSWIAEALRHPFFAAPPPKSLDRNAFADLDASRLSPTDGAATLTAFTAAAIAAVLPLLPRPPRAWIVAGGGARNPTLMRILSERLAPAVVETAQSVGWSSDAIEAQAFAYLAVRALKRLPITFPATTGAPAPMTGGVVAGISDQGSGIRPKGSGLSDT
jgi:anhydro-N-acetylmuramic acid kinase